MKWIDNRRHLNPLLPKAYRRWPLLSGISAGLWLLVLVYLVRMILSLIRGDQSTAFYSLLWSLVCLILWTLLFQWARHKPVD
ncbi:MAG: hypothetical protein A3F83_08100 [Candidatus Glassbacteria bacterium RIFCSPLOWO2_12_FULL_58_11]|uniref:Uncharacterized protein n=1 Tax=Candidatus Glassbacteria bacterium RIFCSPLOWO2_12_FULL_58_11 TaxID=1817867 RepID=A0A1F5YK31_9BACT|nr:MAG: hypothetical protein A3F83_08100 [Candidatus Glassbacteria bacterium RIFCSPLOWO2_12_FULL_58_11]